MILYSVTAQVVEETANGTVSRQVPVFLLNSDEKQVERVAADIINPTHNPNLQVHACCVPWREL